jgi:DNA-binding transcriptional ArsR family regulator
MVIQRSSSTPATLVDVFRALADPTRVAVVERLGVDAASTSELARSFDMALPSFTQHLDVLEQCGIVTSHKQGRVRTYRLTPEPLERAAIWLAGQRDHWTRRFDRLDEHVLTMFAPPASPDPTRPPTPTSPSTPDMERS